MQHLIIADTGPLIALARINILHFLSQIFRQVVVPESVFNEACSDLNKPGAKAILSISENPWFKCVAVDANTEQPGKSLNNSNSVLDRGERDVITLAMQLDSIALIDEKRGRKVANSNGVKCIGTAAIPLKLKEKGLIDSVSPYLDELATAGYRLSVELTKKVKCLADE